ncbi:hypothetical protein AB0C65_38240 [Nocardia sp. NPDC048505]|uniref:hypothetical protein n=1 Tax=Nocardia sp. NPDC048505 TaxID=3155756 RepID=UPI0033D97117
MPSPNVNPNEHGEEISGLTPAQRQAELDSLAGLQADLDGSKAAQLAEQLLVPVVPDGGGLGRVLTPHVSRAARIRDTARLWAPALTAAIAYVLALMFVPLPGPLQFYGLCLVGAAVWMCAGRPGPVASCRMAFYLVADFCAAVKRRVIRLSERRGRFETRRVHATTSKEN